MASLSTNFNPALELILIEVELEGPRDYRQFTFILDTGCSETLVSPEVLDEIGPQCPRR